tara:strand:+ start:706 stop:1800 length:1095 start_codon:yes stop_codon:yes gene_type:complete
MNTNYHINRSINRLRTGLISQEVPNELIFFVTNVCNFRCNHCFNQNLGSSKYDLSLSEIEKIVSSLNGRKIFNLLISGGEPLIRKDLINIISLFVSSCATSKILITTNGYYTDKTVSIFKALSRKHKKVLFRIHFSIDGLSDYHNFIRGNDSSFEKSIHTIKAIEGLRLKNVEVSTICTITDYNINNVIEFQHYMNNANIEVTYNIGRTNHAMITLPDGSYFSSPHINNQTPEDNGVVPNKKKFIDVINNLYRLKNNKNLFKNIEDKVVEKSLLMGNEFLHGGKINFECSAGNRIGVIYANGDVSLCENYNVVGNLRKFNYDFIKVWNGDVATEQREYVPKCSCAHPCFIHPSLYRNLWRVFFN